MPRCIYLDTDLIILSDLTALQNLDLHDKSTACVIDGVISTPDLQQRLRNMLKLTNSQWYFNSRIIIIDLDALRLREIQFKALDIAKEQHALPDQMDHDALNKALADDWLILDPKWNTSKGKASAGFSDGIIHFLAKVKPWHEDYAGNFKEEWFAILDRTVFAGQRPAMLMGIAAAYQKFSRSISTVDIVPGKLRRLIRSNLWFTRCILVSRGLLCASQVHSCLSGSCLRSP